jgi:two-component system sensor histidine kinase RstB
VRLDSSRQRRTGGAGIGLSMVRVIMERHGGVVAVQEAPELGGARFVLDLPRASTKVAI